MSDIFLSYAREDLERARQLATAIDTRGWTVFWDIAIPPGQSFDSFIEEALDRASCVVVLWSRASVESRWAVAEAEEGMRRGILLPVLLEPVRVPLAFRLLQSVDLAEWTGDPNDALLLPLLHAIGQLLGPSREVERPAEAVVKPGNVFVSYAKEDLKYVQDLIALLRNSGLSVWADDRIDYGELWWRTIVANIRSYTAMVVVMTPSSEESRWVEREILLADKLEKPIFPLLLRGECFPLLLTIQYHDITNGAMPPTTFVTTLRRLAAGYSASPSGSPSPREHDPYEDLQRIPTGQNIPGFLPRIGRLMRVLFGRAQ